MLRSFLDYRSEPGDPPLQVDPPAAPVEIVEPDPHRGDVTFDGGQLHDHFV